MLKIILIEDNPGDARLIQEMLEDKRDAMPFEFECFNRLASGLERLAKGNVNVVLLDLGLPDSQGFNTFFKVYGQTKQVPIIVLTGLNDRELADKALREGAQDYLIKGQIDSNLLRRSIRYAIERKLSEMTLRQTNRALKVHSECNNILIRATEESSFLQDICKTIVEVGGFRMIWVGFVEQDEKKTLRPVAHYGYENGYLDLLNISWANTENGQGPSGMAIRNGNPSICKNIINDPLFAPWRDEALKSGYASSIALPLIDDGNVFGAINIYAVEPNAFNDEEVKLLTELADDLSYGIVSIRNEVKRKQAEEDLKASETRYRRLFESAKDGILILDADTGEITDVNPFMEEILGYSRDEFLGKKLWELGFFKDIVLCKAAFQELQSKGYIRYEDLPLRTKSGQLNDVEFVSNVYLVNDKKVIQCNIRDVTERKRAQELLRESEERFRLSFENTNIGMCLVNTEGCFIKVNKVMCEMFGYSKEELEKLTVNDIAHPEDLDISPTFIRRASSGEINEAKFEKRYIHKKGQVVWGQESSSVVRDAKGVPLYFISHIQDITERKQAEEELQKYHLHLEELVEERTKQLQETNKELEAFVYSASHDLKNPLHTIEGFANILLEDYSIHLDADGQRFLNIITSNTTRMNQLIRDLLDFSHLGHKEIKISDIDIKGIVESVFEELKSFIKQTAQLDIKPLLSAKGDLSLIRQVFINLLSNALKFTRTREQPIIEIGSRIEGNQNVYYIKDNGIGFNIGDADKLFTPFKRLHSTEEFEGTGIGLAIVERIISKHNGRVWAEGKVNEGATFYFALPNINNKL